MRLLFTTYLAIIIGIFNANAQSCASSYIQRIRGSHNSAAILATAQQAEKYLYTPGSEGYDEGLFIQVLEAVMESPMLSEVDKIRPRSLLDMALKNRPGDKAADIVYVTPDDSIHSLSNRTATYAILFFNDPDCDDCAIVKKQIAQNELLCSLVADGSLEIIGIYPFGDEDMWRTNQLPSIITNGFDRDMAIETDETYCIRQIPTLYLLKGMTVMLKDTTLPEILAKLQKVE